MKTRRSRRLFERARRVIPGGVNSPVRAFGAVGGDAALHRARRAARAIWDADGNALHRLRRLVGPDDPRPRRPRRAARGARGGCATARASARRPSSRSSSRERVVRRAAVDRARALRLLGHRGDDERAAARARGHRPRRASSSSTAATTATPTRCSSARAAASRRSASPARRACPRRSPSSPCTAPYNDLGGGRGRVRALGRARSPASSSSRSRATWAACCPSRASSRACASCATAHGALLIFDEVMTGFRVARGGAQERFGVRARPHLPRQGGRRRAARGGLRRAARADATGSRPTGPSTRRARSRAIRSRWPRAARRSTGSPGRGVYEQLERDAAARSPTGLARSGRRGRRAAHGRRGRRDVRLLLPPGPGAQLRRREEGRRRPLPALLRRDARRGRLPRAVAVRGGLRLARPPAARRRGDARGGARRRCAQRGRARVEARGGLG